MRTEPTTQKTQKSQKTGRDPARDTPDRGDPVTSAEASDPDRPVTARPLPWYAHVPAPGITTWYHRRVHERSWLTRLRNRMARR